MVEDELVEVTQADRDAAADLIQWQRGVGTTNKVVAEMRAGERDDSGTIEAFARHRLAAVEAERAWQPIETAPTDGTPLLLFARSVNATAPVVVIGWYLQDQGWIESAFAPNSPVGIVPTHWQPQPSFPAIRNQTHRDKRG